MSRKLFVAGMLGVAAMGLVFQNCGRVKTSDESGQLTSKSVVCPLYMEPLCEADEVVTIVPDDCGGHPICTKKLIAKDCPQYMEPICDDGEVVVVLPDESSCPVPSCGSLKAAPHRENYFSD